MKPITSAGMGLEPRMPGSDTTMKVNPRDDSNGKIRAVTGESARPASEPTRAAGADSVRLSGELKLADRAVRAASVAIGTPPEAVAHARALLASGEHYERLWNQRSRLSALPVLVIWGMRDPAFKPTALARWRSAVPHASVVELPVGHWPQEEAPDDVIRALRSMLM